jgi:phosphoribosylanthranilate isomerase
VTAAIQIYCRRPSHAEVGALLEMGVEYIGFDVRPEDGAMLREARDLVDLIRSKGAASSVLVHERKWRRLATLAMMLEPDYLLMSSDREDGYLGELAQAVKPKTRLMVPVPVGVGSASELVASVSMARNYAAVAGALTVDTCLDPQDLGRVGCTGVTPDWNVCRAVVDAVPIPVVLAGGLNPENVQQAIAIVRPAIVDACTSLEFPDRTKDLRKCQAFVSSARGVQP